MSLPLPEGGLSRGRCFSSFWARHLQTDHRPSEIAPKQRSSFRLRIAHRIKLLIATMFFVLLLVTPVSETALLNSASFGAGSCRLPMPAVAQRDSHAGNWPWWCGVYMNVARWANPEVASRRIFQKSVATERRLSFKCLCLNAGLWFERAIEEKWS